MMLHKKFKLIGMTLSDSQFLLTLYHIILYSNIQNWHTNQYNRTSDKIGINQKEEWNNLKQEVKDGKLV